MNKILAIVAALAFSPFASAQVLIENLPAGAAIAGTEPIPTVQSAITVKTTPADIQTYIRSTAAPVSAGGTGAVTLTGPLKGNGTAAIGAAASTDIIGLWSGTCNSGTYLRADGSCQAIAVTPGGSDTQVQYNNAGALAGDPDYAWNATTNVLSVGATATAGIIQGAIPAASTSAGALITLRGGAGGSTSGAAGGVTVAGGTPVDGAGGNVAITGSSGVGTNRAGGSITGSGGTAVGSATGGAITLTSGNGGPTGAGGNFTASAGSGGNTSGAAGTAILQGGGVGNSSGLDGGLARVNGGGGNGAGAGGQVLISAGTAGVTGAGGNVNITASNGGTTSGNGGSIGLSAGGATSGAGGSVSIDARNGVGTNQAGGTVIITAGNPTGSGTPGYVQFVGMEAGTQSGTAPVITNGTTITATGVSLARVAPGGAVTGIILQAGTIGGQRLIVVNESTAGSSATMAVAGTSRVANGTSCVIAGNQARGFVWNSATSLWYEMK
jgi:hypothetical protein